MKKILQILSVLLLSCMTVVLLGVIKSQKAHAGGPVNCLFDNTDNPTAQNSMWLSCGTDPMVYDVERSLEHGTPTFVAYKSNGNAADGFVEYRGVNCNGTFGVVAYQNNQLVQTEGKQACRTVRNPEKFNVDPDNIPANQQPLCSMKNTSAGCKVWNGTWSLGSIDGAVGEIKDGYDIGRNSPNGVFVGGAPGYNVVLNPAPLPAVNATNNSKTVCVDSPLSFFLCPLSDFVTNMVTGIFKAIQKLLIAPSLSGDNGPNSNLANAVGAMKNIANSAYAVLFLIIIIGNFIAIPGLDNYTIKKLLPRLIFVIVVTQFAFLICSLIIDFGNVLGFIIPSAIATAYNGNKAISASQFIAQSFNPLVNLTSGNVSQIVTGLAEGIGLWFFGFAFALVALVVAIIGFCYLIFRYFALVVLVVISPIALAAFVLPNTVNFTTWWIKNFFKMVLIYPLVMLLFVIAAIAADIFGKSGSFLGPLIAAAMPLIALLIVPKIFKWSGGIIGSAGKILSQSTAGKAGSSAAKGAVKKSSQEGKLAEVKGSAMEKFGKQIGGERGLKLEAKGRNTKLAPGKRLQENLESLGIDRALQERNSGGDIGAAANRIITAKRRDLANTRNLDAGQMYEAMRVMDPNRSADDIRNEMTQSYGVTFGQDGKVITDTADPNYSPTNAATFSNPYYQGTTTPTTPAPPGNPPPNPPNPPTPPGNPPTPPNPPNPPNPPTPPGNPPPNPPNPPNRPGGPPPFRPPGNPPTPPNPAGGPPTPPAGPPPGFPGPPGP